MTPRQSQLRCGAMTGGSASRFWASQAKLWPSSPVGEGRQTQRGRCAGLTQLRRWSSNIVLVAPRPAGVSISQSLPWGFFTTPSACNPVVRRHVSDSKFKQCLFGSNTILRYLSPPFYPLRSATNRIATPSVHAPPTNPFPLPKPPTQPPTFLPAQPRRFLPPLLPSPLTLAPKSAFHSRFKPRFQLYQSGIGVRAFSY